jgi:Flp pilus assembly protein TadG
VFARFIRVRARRHDSGAAALEFALIGAFIFFPLVLGILQYGWYFYVAQTTGGATSHVARRLAVGDCWGANEALTFVQGEVGSNPVNTTLDMDPTVNTDAEIGIDQVTVVVTADANVIGFWPMPHDGIITRTVKTMIEDTTSSGAC